jgi:hypothetical protein
MNSAWSVIFLLLFALVDDNYTCALLRVEGEDDMDGNVSVAGEDEKGAVEATE